MYTPNFNIKMFLNDVWQKKPTVIRNGFANFIDPISSDELAGLAMEEEVSSRVVITKDNDWSIEHGPFQVYEQFGDSRWQLLVQAANHWHQESLEFVNAFRFLPDWRFDDLMVSFATPNGGVGPHIDNYDVFIVQGSGKRHWKVGDKGDYKKRNNDPQSALIEDFDPIIDATLEPGDILYIPPGFPHCGTTLTNSMSYSLGFRAPSQQELFSSIADYLMDNDAGEIRFVSNENNSSAGVISNTEQQGLLNLIVNFSQSPLQYQHVLGSLLSQNRFELDICPDDEITIEELSQAINEGYSLFRVGGLKILRLEDDESSRLFVDGEVFDFEHVEHSVLIYLSDNFTYENTWLSSKSDNKEINKFLLEMCKRGYFYFD